MIAFEAPYVKYNLWFFWEKSMYVCGYPTYPAKKYQSKTFFRQNLQKIIEDLYLLTERSAICIFCAI